jgi:solute carrier family 35, member E3
MSLNYLSTFFFSLVVLFINNNYIKNTWFTYKKLPLRPNVILAFISAISMMFINLSLQFNSVGFYQVWKLLIIPTQLLLNYFLYKIFTDKKIIISLFILLFGVGIVIVSDVEVNFIGTIFAFVGCVTTALSQVTLQNQIHKELDANPFQLVFFFN